MSPALNFIRSRPTSYENFTAFDQSVMIFKVLFNPLSVGCAYVTRPYNFVVLYVSSTVDGARVDLQSKHFRR